MTGVSGDRSREGDVMLLPGSEGSKLSDTNAKSRRLKNSAASSVVEGIFAELFCDFLRC